MIKRLLTCLTLLGVAAGCQSNGKKNQPGPPTLADRIATAHGASDWAEKKALSGHMVVAFEKQPLMEFDFIHEIGAGRTRFTMADGTVLLWDGQKAWVSPGSATMPMARFHLLTWPYFMTVPFKLHDPGVKLSETSERQLSSKTFLSSTMSFAPGTGDAPDDWYILYADPRTARLEAMAYIVTYGNTKEKAEESPHAITYYDFKRIEGALIAHDWRFWNWNPTVGLHGQPLGRAVLSGLEFRPVKADAFEKPADAKEDPRP